jgi:hypothetical protein
MASLMMVMLPSLVFSKVQVTFSPAARLMMAVGPLVLVELPPVQVRSVRVQPPGTVSVTDRKPGRRPEKTWVLDRVASASSSRLKPERPSPEVV